MASKVPRMELGIVGKSGGFEDLFVHQADICREWPKIDVMKWGRGAGKSATLLVKVLLASMLWPGISILYVAPVAKIWRLAVFPKLRKILRLWKKQTGLDVVEEWDKNKGYLRFIWGSEINFHTGTNIDNARGGDIGLLVVEEGGYVQGDQSSWASLLPSLRGLGPGCLLIGGTPDGNSGILGAACILADYPEDGENRDFRKTIELEAEDMEPEVITIRITRRGSVDNPYYPRATIALARRTLTPERFAEEMEGRGRKPSNLVYPEFDLSTNVAPKPFLQMVADHGDWRCVPIIDWGFSKSHVMWTLMRQGRGDPCPTMLIYRDMPLDRTGHEEICRLIAERANQDPISIRAIVVDPEGGGLEAGKFIENRYAIKFFARFGIPVIFEKNKSKRNIVSTADLVRRMLRTADGHARLMVTQELVKEPAQKPGGRGVIASFLGYGLKEAGQGTGEYLDKPHDDNKTAHSMDCVRMAAICAPKIGFSFLEGMKGQLESGGTK